MDIEIVYSDSAPYGRFILLGYDSYYPNGGLGDYLHTSDDLLEVLREGRKYSFDWLDIFDTEARKEIDIEATLEANSQLKEQLLQKETA